MLALQTLLVEQLWVVSSLLGGVYGALFNVMPMLVLEWFGIGESIIPAANFQSDQVSSGRAVPSCQEGELINQPTLARTLAGSAWRPSSAVICSISSLGECTMHIL